MKKKLDFRSDYEKMMEEHLIQVSSLQGQMDTVQDLVQKISADLSSTMIMVSSLVELLISKGILSEDEYVDHTKQVHLEVQTASDEHMKRDKKESKRQMQRMMLTKYKGAEC